MRGGGKVLFRVAAGPTTGLGHLRRSLSLARALEHKGIRSCFWMSGGGENLLRRSGVPMELIAEEDAWGRGDAERVRESVRREGVGAVVMDAPGLRRSYVAQVAKSGALVVVRDDLGKVSYPAHLVVNGNVDAVSLPYERDPKGRTEFLLGLRYQVLPEGFWAPRPRRIHHPIRRLLVSLGGADVRNRMPRLVALLDGLPGRFEAAIVIGPFFRNRVQILSAIRASSRRVRLLDQPASLERWIRGADLAVSAGGQTLYELACAGCPTVVIQTGKDQAGQMKAMEKSGCVEVVEKITLLRKTVRNLLRDSSRRRRMSDAGRRLVDGRGAFRVARQILAAMSVLSNRVGQQKCL